MTSAGARPHRRKPYAQAGCNRKAAAPNGVRSLLHYELSTGRRSRPPGRNRTRTAVPWAFSPRTSSVRKAGIHLSAARAAENRVGRVPTVPSHTTGRTGRVPRRFLCAFNAMWRTDASVRRKCVTHPVRLAQRFSPSRLPCRSGATMASADPSATIGWLGPSATNGRRSEAMEPTMVQDAQGHHLSGATEAAVTAYHQAVRAFKPRPRRRHRLVRYGARGRA